MASKDELKQMLEKPILMAPNNHPHFYNGGKLRADFVGEPDPKDDYRPEEWMFSTNRATTPGRENPPDKGFSRFELPGGEIVLLKDLLEVFPGDTLGEAHHAKFGATLGVLVKIFDVGDGSHVPVHWHPSPEFASKYLDSPYGKNETWVVIGTRPGARAWVGFKEDISKEEFTKLVDAQDVETMRSHMHEIKPQVGDVVFVRDSIVHSLGTGLCILEPQEPTDWNFFAEWEQFGVEKEDALLGLDWDTALSAANLSAMSMDYLNGYVCRTPEIARKEKSNVEEQLVPEEAKAFFNVKRFRVSSKIAVPGGQGFHCITATRGSGALSGDFGDVPFKRGQGLFIPTCLPGYELVNTGAGTLEVVYCYPPEL
jgi:mannose-6-phosphate isomerase